MVYALKKDMNECQPAHYLCAACFQNNKASILQSREGKPRKEGGRIFSVFACISCGGEATTRWMNAVAPQYLEDIKPEE
jgi:hypothetical protein